MFHILFKNNENEIFSQGKSYEGDVCSAYEQWRIEYPDAIFIGLYPHKKIEKDETN